MHVKLGFSHGPDALMMTVLRQGERPGSHILAILQYANEQALLRVISEAAINAGIAARIVEAVAASAAAPGTDPCSIELALSDQQFHTLIVGATQNEAT